MEDDNVLIYFAYMLFDGVGDAQVESFTLPKDQSRGRSFPCFQIRHILQPSFKVTHVVSPFGDENPFLEAANQLDEPELGRASGRWIRCKFLSLITVPAPDRIGRLPIFPIITLNKIPLCHVIPVWERDYAALSVTAADQLREAATKYQQLRLGYASLYFPEKHPTRSRRQFVNKQLFLVLDFLDPVAVCRMKMVSKTCYRYIDEHLSTGSCEDAKDWVV
jgi:hypothetical protein